MADEAKERISASFQKTTVDKINEIAAKEKRSFSLMCELLVLEAIDARHETGVKTKNY